MQRLRELKLNKLERVRLKQNQIEEELRKVKEQFSMFTFRELANDDDNNDETGRKQQKQRRQQTIATSTTMTSINGRPSSPSWQDGLTIAEQGSSDDITNTTSSPYLAPLFTNSNTKAPEEDDNDEGKSSSSPEKMNNIRFFDPVASTKRIKKRRAKS